MNETTPWDRRHQMESLRAWERAAYITRAVEWVALLVALYERDGYILTFAEKVHNRKDLEEIRMGRHKLSNNKEESWHLCFEMRVRDPRGDYTLVEPFDTGIENIELDASGQIQVKYRSILSL